MRPYLILLVLLTACQQNDPWGYNQIASGDKQYNSTKLSCFTSDLVNGLDLEFMRISTELRTYLNVHSLPVPASAKNPKSTSATLTIQEETISFQAWRHEGGQRFLLPPEISERIVEALNNDLPVRIQLARYQSTITPKGFKQKFQKMMRESPQQQSFHLPF